MNKIYKINFKQSYRYFIFIFLLFVLFSIFLYFYYFLKNYFFLLLSTLILFFKIFFILKIIPIFKQKIIINDDSIDFYYTGNVKETINFSDIKYFGYYKKDLNNFDKFSFGDGFYIYDEKNDKYFFMGISFNNYKELYNLLLTIISKYKKINKNIKRNNNSTLVGELKKII